MDSVIAATVFGIAGNICSTALFLPNALTVWRRRNDPSAMRGVSSTMQVLVLCNAALWACYAAITEAWWAAAPGLFNVPLALFVLYLIRSAAKRRANEATNAGTCSCGWVLEHGPHELFCVAPPGYGTRRSCPGDAPAPQWYIAAPATGAGRIVSSARI